MSPEVLGVEMDANVRMWGNAQRRVGSLLALGVAAVLLVAAVVTYLVFGPDGAIAYWSLLVLVALALAFQVVLLVVQPRPAQAAAPAWAPAPQMQPEAAPEATPEPQPAPAARPVWAPPVEETRTLTLRCSDCGTVFDVTDTGQRPLHHSCPGCGAEGMLRDDAQSASAPAAPEPIVAAAPLAPPVKRLKLRCGGCKEIFAIEDTGERPLRRPCPYCGRTGEVR